MVAEERRSAGLVDLSSGETHSEETQPPVIRRNCAV